MRPGFCRVPALLILAALLPLSGCAVVSEAKHKAPEPYSREKIAEPDLYRITLTTSAATRLNVQTAPVRNARTPGGTLRKTIPYGALIYDIGGSTWAYSSPKELVYVRESVVIDVIEGGHAYLIEGPEVGTPIVTFGAAELYGIEFGLGK